MQVCVDYAFKNKAVRLNSAVKHGASPYENSLNVHESRNWLF